MYIKGIYTKGTQRRYYICEKDGASENLIAWFDRFEEAGIVLRYLKGSNMRAEDQEEAIYLMRDFDLHKSKSQYGEAEQTADTPPVECAKS